MSVCSYESRVTNRLLGRSARVGGVNVAAFSAVYGSFPIVATGMMVIISPPSRPKMSHPRVCGVSASTMPFVKPRVTPVSRVRGAFFMGIFATRKSHPCFLAAFSLMPIRDAGHLVDSTPHTTYHIPHTTSIGARPAGHIVHACPLRAAGQHAGTGHANTE